MAGMTLRGPRTHRDRSETSASLSSMIMDDIPLHARLGKSPVIMSAVPVGGRTNPKEDHALARELVW
jgi:hypothetical protein